METRLNRGGSRQMGMPRECDSVHDPTATLAIPRDRVRQYCTSTLLVFTVVLRTTVVQYDLPTRQWRSIPAAEEITSQASEGTWTRNRCRIVMSSRRYLTRNRPNASAPQLSRGMAG